MKPKPDLYHRERGFKNSLERVKHSSKLSKQNKNDIFSFIDDMRASKMSLARMIKYMHYLKKFGEMLGKDFKAAEEKDIKKVIVSVNESDYSLHTKHDISVLVKRFYKWLEGDNETYPKKVRWITTTMTRQEKQSLYPKTHEIPTAEDVKKMIDKAKTPRDKCIVAMLFDSACRIGELLNVQIKDITMHGKDRAFVSVEGKTGTRKVYIKFSVGYLAAWLNVHPHRHNKDFYNSWLFLNSAEKRLGYATIRGLLLDLKVKAGLKPHVKVNPHAFRHAQITELFRLGVNEPVTKKQVGWSNSTRMVEVYSHLTTKDVENAIDRAHRDSNDPPEPQPLNPLKAQKCDFCGTENTATAKYCEGCGSSLNKKTLIEEGEAREKLISLLEIPSVRKAIFEAMESNTNH